MRAASFGLGLLGLGCLGLLMLSAREGRPSPGFKAEPSQVQRSADELARLADGYLSLTQTYDAELAKTVFPERIQDQAQSHFAWLHASVGACIERRVLGVRRGELARFELRCERGVAEVALAPSKDSGAPAARMYAGLRNVAPRSAVVAQARALVGWRAARNPAPDFVSANKRKAFVRAFDLHAGERFSCRLGAPLLASQSGAVFDLHCDDVDDARLVIDLDDGGRVRRALVATGPVRG